MMKHINILALTCIIIGASALPYNLVYNPQPLVAAPAPLGVIHDANAADPRYLAHPAVVANAAADAQLPPELRNDFYKNTHVAQALARESWFTDKEFPVFNRQAEKIPRAEIAKIINRIKHLERRR